jgi:hypothetical protein
LSTSSMAMAMAIMTMAIMTMSMSVTKDSSTVKDEMADAIIDVILADCDCD